jgi:asparagine synthase (glutamine-hydrolysing)
LETGLGRIRHRGPDATNQLMLDDVYLGHNRLSIIDLSTAANQPLKAADAEAWIIYNGEIYNYKELKSALKDGPFVTSGDTEVLLRGYLEEGVQFFKRLRGIYSFAILDKRGRTRVVLGRDPSGIKPLYWFRSEQLLAFGSEIKAITPVVGNDLSVNDAALKTYLNLGYCPEPFTIYREIHALTPGHVVVASVDRMEEIPVFRFDFTRENSLSFEENAERTESLVNTAVRRNLVADVPAAVALSGGIDSSLVYAAAHGTDQTIRGLTVRFADSAYDETDAAAAYASHVAGTHQVLDIQSDFSLELLNKILLHFDQPYADSSAVPTYYLTRATRQLTKILLGGDGGDELYNGYRSQAWLHYVNKIRKVPAGTAVLKALLGLGGLAGADARRISARVQLLADHPPSDMVFDWHSWLPRNTSFNGGSAFLYDKDAGLELYTQAFENYHPSGFEQSVTFEHFTRTLLSDYLRKTDMMSMMNGVEYRVPLLDEDLAAFALTIPFTQKSSVTQSKKILRHLHARRYPPASSRSPKRGFAIPLDVYLTAADLRCMRDLLTQPGGIAAHYIRPEYISFLFDAALGRTDASAQVSRAGIYQRLLILYSLELWHSQASAR